MQNLFYNVVTKSEISIFFELKLSAKFSEWYLPKSYGVTR
jgi:hypothetical protein